MRKVMLVWFLVCLPVLAACQIINWLKNSTTSFSYANVKADKVYHYTYDKNTDTYSMLVPELHIKVTVPNFSGSYFSDNEDMRALYESWLSWWVHVKDNIIEQIPTGEIQKIAFFSKDSNAGVLQLPEIKERFHLANADCTLHEITHEITGNPAMLHANNVKTYNLNPESFSEESVISWAFAEGYYTVCGDPWNVIYYSSSYPDRYIMDMRGKGYVALWNNIVVEYTD